MARLWQENLFDVEEITAINDELKQKQHEAENMKARLLVIPTLPYFEHPKDDNEKMLNYQYLYLKNNDQEAWGKLIELAFIVTKRLVWRWMKIKKISLDDIEQDDRTSVAVEYVLRRYKKNIGYAITKNYISALKDGVKHAMLYTTKLQRETVYIDDVYGELNNWAESTGEQI